MISTRTYECNECGEGDSSPGTSHLPEWTKGRTYECPYCGSEDIDTWTDYH